MANFASVAVTVLLAAPVFGGELEDTLKKIEQRYNSTRTLKSEFEQTVALGQGAGGRKQVERGVLYLRKPGKMRWEYAQPEGKLFLSDAKRIYYVSPASRRVEVSAVRETEDLRAPLAFLLGKLDFQRDFGRFETSTAGGGMRIRAFAKNDKTLFASIDFTPGPAGELTSVIVNGRDGSRMEYAFRNEQRNVPLAEALFQFQPPAGYETVELRGEP